MSDAETVVRETFRLLESRQATEAVELLDPDIEWRNTGLPAVRGQRVHRMFQDMERRGIAISLRVHHLAATDDVVLTDRTDVLSYRRWSTSFWVRGTFVVRDGRILVWDDAFSWTDFTGGGLVGLARMGWRRG